MNRRLSRATSHDLISKEKERLPGRTSRTALDWGPGFEEK